MIAQDSDTQRLAPVDPPYGDDVAHTLERLMGGAGAEPLLLFRTIAHNPTLLDKLRTTGTYLLNFGTIDALEREIVILRTCARCGCEYEWGVHVAIFATAVGLSDEQVAATCSDDDAAWDERQRALIALVDQLHDASTVTDGLWAALRATYRPDQLVELVTLVGQYHNVSFTANALGVQLESFAARFPR
jgi:4-carboxymuconolactone decarboxylase